MKYKNLFIISSLIVFFGGISFAQADTFYAANVMVNVNIENQTRPGASAYQNGDVIKVTGSLYSATTKNVTFGFVSIGTTQTNLIDTPTLKLTATTPSFISSPKYITVSVPQGDILPKKYTVDFTVGVEHIYGATIGVAAFQNMGFGGNLSFPFCFGMSGNGSGWCPSNNTSNFSWTLGPISGYRFLADVDLNATAPPINANKTFLIRWTQQGTAYTKYLTVHQNSNQNIAHTVLFGAPTPNTFISGPTNYNSELVLGQSTGFLSGGPTNVCAAAQDTTIEILNVPVCAGGFQLPVCSNTTDDDGDGLIDQNDPGCHTDLDANNPLSYDQFAVSEYNYVAPQCSDFIDNDGDGRTDMEDPECYTDFDVNNPMTYDPSDNSETF